MFLHIQNVLTAEEIAFFQQHLGPDAPWVDGVAAQGARRSTRKTTCSCRKPAAVCPAAGQR